jgi:hypothetical protein
LRTGPNPYDGNPAVLFRPVWAVKNLRPIRLRMGPKPGAIREMVDAR